MLLVDLLSAVAASNRERLLSCSVSERIPEAVLRRAVAFTLKS